jgi:adenosylcobinamide-phosphate synthase
VLADPARAHPVAAFGTVAAALERRDYRDSRLAGAAHTAALVGFAAGLGAAARAGAGRRPAGRLGLTAAATWTVLGGTSLRRHGRALGAELRAGDVTAARARLPALCGRDPDVLGSAELAAAGVESVAENTSDAVVAPLLWGAVAGVPGLLGYRAVNTLDAMIGHRDPRYRRFGWAAARLDDLTNLIPARVAALAACACAPVVGGSPADAFWVTRRDSPGHASPNAGLCEASFAGALGLRLGGDKRYAHGEVARPRMGFGPPPGPADLDRAAALSAAVTALTAALAVGVAALGAVAATAGGRADR